MLDPPFNAHMVFDKHFLTWYDEVYSFVLDLFTYFMTWININGQIYQIVFSSRILGTPNLIWFNIDVTQMSQIVLNGPRLVQSIVVWT